MNCTKGSPHLLPCLLSAVLLLLLAACSGTRYVPEGAYKLQSVKVTTAQPDFDPAPLSAYVRQKPDGKLFTRKPVLYDSLLAAASCADLSTAMRGMGYLHATTSLTTHTKGKKLQAIYELMPGKPYFIRNIQYEISDTVVERLLNEQADRSLIKSKALFNTSVLDAERKRITDLLKDNGYYRFHKDYISYTADSTANSHNVDLTMLLRSYQKEGSETDTLHPRYKVRRVNDEILPPDGPKALRKSVIENNCAIREGHYFSNADLQKTYNNFGRLQAVRYTNIKFSEQPDSMLLDCDLQVSLNKPSTIAFQPEGTNTAGDLGAAATLTYENRNLFRGSEVLSIGIRAAFEAITGLEGYQNEDYEEYNIETRLQFPRLMAPLVSKAYQRRSSATSELSLSYNLQNRPEFHRRVFSLAWRYRWTDLSRHTTFRIDLPDLNYVLMPWISSTFKHDYLDSVSNRNAILRYNYEDLFITKTGFGLTYNHAGHVLRANVETSGNLLAALASTTKFHKNDRDQYTLFNIAFAQYAKFDLDYTHLWALNEQRFLAFHADFGIAYPYGNSQVLPFEKRYFAGGANSVRGWSVRELGPGAFRGTDGRIDFINQTGDLKLDLNLEYRMPLFWKLNGAAFLDAGNIWTLRDYAEQPGGQFRLSEFYKQIAMAYGFGLRLNFDYFVLRFDLGMKAINPAYDDHRHHYPIIHPRLSRDLSFHFAVGLPF